MRGLLRRSTQTIVLFSSIFDGFSPLASSEHGDCNHARSYQQQSGPTEQLGLLTFPRGRDSLGDARERRGQSSQRSRPHLHKPPRTESDKSSRCIFPATYRTFKAFTSGSWTTIWLAFRPVRLGSFRTPS